MGGGGAGKGLPTHIASPPPWSVSRQCPLGAATFLVSTPAPACLSVQRRAMPRFFLKGKPLWPGAQEGTPGKCSEPQGLSGLPPSPGPSPPPTLAVISPGPGSPKDLSFLSSALRCPALRAGRPAGDPASPGRISSLPSASPVPPTLSSAHLLSSAHSLSRSAPGGQGVTGQRQAAPDRQVAGLASKGS